MRVARGILVGGQGRGKENFVPDGKYDLPFSGKNDLL